LNRRIKKLIKIPLISLLVAGLCLIPLISYISFCKLVYVENDVIIEGETIADFAKKTRRELKAKYNAKKFTCKTEDNISLKGLYVERENPTATLLLCHGYRCCKEVAAKYLEVIPNCNAVTFDFRGHGQNKRMITTIGCHEHKDIFSVIAWMKKNKPSMMEKPLIILGISMGGAAAIRAAEECPNLCDALIVDSSFANLKSVMMNAFESKSGLPLFPFFSIMEKMLNYFGKCTIANMNTLKSLKTIKIPLLLIHSCVDKLVPVQESLLMYAQASRTGAKLWIAPKCKHGFLYKTYPHLYRKKINKFVRKKVSAKFC